jgi:hypothetical protein
MAAPGGDRLHPPSQGVRLDVSIAPDRGWGISAAAGRQSEGPAGPLTWVTGRAVVRRMRWGRSIAIQRDRRRGRVDTMISSTSSRLASLRIASMGWGVDDLAVGVRAGLTQPVQLLLQPPLGKSPGDLVGAGDHPAVERAGGPLVGGLGLGDRSHEVEAAWSGPHALGQLGRELVAAEGLVGHDEIASHWSHPLGFIRPPSKLASRHF